MPLPHEKLVAWQRADDLCVKIYRLTAGFPAHERFGVVSQVRRAAYSVPANIVEGLARRSKADKLRFLNIAESSLAEVGYCLHVSRRLGYLTDEGHAEFDRDVRGVAAPLLGLRRSVQGAVT
jgi:four helix bundle protein